MKQSSLARARASWPAPLPDWVETLALECDRTSQNKVAILLDRSSAVVSQVLNNKSPAALHQIEDRVRGVFMDGRVACPGLGEIATQHCQDWRAKAPKLEVGNPLRLRMYRACNRCPRFVQEKPNDATN